jgi:elongation factor 2
MYVAISILLSFLIPIPTAPIEKGSKLETLVVGIRTRKGLKVSNPPLSKNYNVEWLHSQPDIPSLDNYYDKL